MRVQRSRPADVEVKNFGTRLVADGEEVAEAARDEKSNLQVS